MTLGRADQSLVKQLNSALILNLLLADSPQSRANLALRAGLNRSTISSLVSNLIAQGLIREVGLEEADSRGRPGVLLELNPEGGCIVGVEIHVGHVTVILTDFTARTLWRQHVTFLLNMDQTEVIRAAEEMICAALQAGRAHNLTPLGIGLAVAGLVDKAHGTLVYAPNLQWRHVSFRELWGQKFGVPLYIENDGNATALGEHYFGVAKDYDDFLFLGTGIGMSGGLMLNGQLYRGIGGFAGEVGHLIVESGGELCACGRRGCWETLVGTPAVIRGIIHALNTGAPSSIPGLVANNFDRITMDVVVDAADQGDQLALDTLSSIALYLGTGIANLINLFNPALIVLGGELTQAGKYLLPTIGKIIAAESLVDSARMVALAVSSQKTDACARGAAALVIDGIVRDPIFDIVDDR
jgi:predicted NBD/HSP70 family sugar kinase